jgi:tRNA pseudouridine55 synthase
LGRRRRGRPVSGILVLDKPLGESSNRSLQNVKRLYDAAKAGHTGSLDPLATGVLPLCFGEATKFSQYLLDADKGYESTFTLGRTTATADAEGETLTVSDASGVTEAAVEEAMNGLRGEIEQMPPMYSALKQNGQPLYKLARQGIEVERKARPVVIKDFELRAFRGGEEAEVDVTIACSKGTYVRTLAEDLGKVLGCGAYVSALRRTRSGPFTLADSVTIETLSTLKENEQLAQMDELLLPADAPLGSLPLVTLSESGGFYLRQGQPVLVPNAPCSGMVRVALQDGEFLGVGEILDDGRVAPRRLVVTNG